MNILLLSMAVASLSFAVTESRLLLPMRKWAKRKNRFTGRLLSCGYCFGYWAALGVVGIYRPMLLNAWWPADLILAVLIIGWLAGFQWAFMCMLMEKTGK